ncbi:MAG TPA: ATP phosphoribosyltransferase [Xanthomonadaceae bacterium]|nr:ATP phosphoribosyltransferase [Xanthomonadaceae bacterium]
MSIMTRDRLRIATQKSGRLSEPARALLTGAGLEFRESRDRLFCYGQSLPIDLLLVRDDDIPGLIAEGVSDLGIVGRNVFEEARLQAQTAGAPASFVEIRPLGFGRCRLSIAVPAGTGYAGPQDLSGLRIATSYPHLLSDWLLRHGVDARVVTLSGSVEIAPRLGKAEAICDLVSTGGTLVANQLREVEVVLHSEAILAGPREALTDERADAMSLLLRRLEGVIQVQASKLVMLHAARADVPRLIALLPAANAPSVMALDGPGDAVALQAVCRGAITWQHLEDIKRAGGRQVLVLNVEQMLS